MIPATGESVPFSKLNPLSRLSASFLSCHVYSCHIQSDVCVTPRVRGITQRLSAADEMSSPSHCLCHEQECATSARFAM